MPPFVGTAYGQKAAKKAEVFLTNDQIIEMVKAGLSQSLIINQIRNSKTSFDLSTPELIRLSQAGVPDSVIVAMRNPQGAGETLTPQLSTQVAGQAVKLRDGEKVRLILMEDISSATAHAGDRINFNAAEDLKVGEFVAISKGATAFGTVAEASKKKSLGRGGQLTMTMNYVKAVDDQNLRIRATAGREGDDKVGKTVVVAVLAGPFALLVKGKDVVATKGTEFTAYIDEDKEIVVNR
jgi:hypothetical protein